MLLRCRELCREVCKGGDDDRDCVSWRGGGNRGSFVIARAIGPALLYPVGGSSLIMHVEVLVFLLPFRHPPWTI